MAASVTTLLVDGEYGDELMTHPTAKPTARAARTTAPTPIRTTVLRRTEMTTAFRSAAVGDAGVGITRDLAPPTLPWEFAGPEAPDLLTRGGFLARGGFEGRCGSAAKG